MTTVEQCLTFLLPVLGCILPGLIKNDGRSPAVNSAIATGIVLVVAVLQTWIAGQLGINPYLDFPLVLTSMSALLAGPFKPLDTYLQSNLGLVNDALNALESASHSTTAASSTPTSLPLPLPGTAAPSAIILPSISQGPVQLSPSITAVQNGSTLVNTAGTAPFTPQQSISLTGGPTVTTGPANTAPASQQPPPQGGPAA